MQMTPRQQQRAVWLTFAAFSVVAVWIAIFMPQYDVSEYHHYAVLATTPPILHHWPREYPALSQFVFLLPLLLPFSYRFSFAVLTLVILGLLLNAGMKRHGYVWALKLLGYLSLGTIGLFAQRYDIFASIFGFLAIEHALQRKWSWAWIFSVIGFLLKLWPAVFWPVFLIQEWRETKRLRWDRFAVSLLTGLVVIAFQALTASHQAFTSFRYLLDRPVEIGSLAASLTSLVTHPHLFAAFGSIDVRAHGMAHLIADVVTALGIVSWLSVFWAQWKGRMEFVDAAIMTLGILLLATKVFSAQYLIWFAPLLALKKGNGGFLLAFALTTVGYPVGYAVPGMFKWVIYIFTARNLFLAAGLAYFAWNQSRSVHASLPLEEEVGH